jgi:hypothetical protein
MPPRITAESCRPRVSDRTMRYHLEWITMTACQFREAEWRRYNNGDMKTHHWKAAESRNFRCDEKRPGTRTNAHGSRVFTRTLTRARMPRQKSVGVEPEGELFLLTFLFIGQSELTETRGHIQKKPASRGQIVGTPVCHAGGGGFESPRSRQIIQPDT